VRLPASDHVRLCRLANIVGPKTQRAQAVCIRMPESVHDKLLRLVVDITQKHVRPVTKQEVVLFLIKKACESATKTGAATDSDERLTKRSVVIGLIEAA